RWFCAHSHNEYYRRASKVFIPVDCASLSGQVFESQLAQAFDDMAENLKKTTVSRDELNAANRQLEASNQQLRTGEQQLKAANQRLQATEEQLKANEEELRQGKTVYKAMFEGAISGIAIYEGVNDGGDFIFKDVNPAAEKIDKIKKQDLTGKSVKDVFPGVYEMGIFDALKRVWKTGKEEYLPAAMYKDKEIKEWRENHIFKLSSGEVVVFYKDITELKQAEEQLKENNEQLRALTAKLSFTEDRERKHIAEGIHDSIIQPLVFLDIKAKSLGKTTKNTKLIEAYSQMRTILNELIEKARTFIFDLSYPTLYELGLEPAIEEWLQTEIEDKHEIAAEFKVETQSKDLDQNIATFLFKSAKELLINVVKHAKANNVKVSIARKQNNIILCVEDDGCGFKSFRSDKKHNSLTGFGLFNIREQVTYLGGEVSIDSKAGIGSKIILTVPLTVPLKDEAYI
ncbi:MAG: ATP-binding protein, partial [Candidatus Omnitrophica bacterium]|nr:ATP-binding protein [Candidatus Omnitrophota bacterium]